MTTTAEAAGTTDSVTTDPGRSRLCGSRREATATAVRRSALLASVGSGP